MIRPAPGHTTPELFRLRKEHQHARAARRHQLKLRLLRVARDGQAIALLAATVPVAAQAAKYKKLNKDGTGNVVFSVTAVLKDESGLTAPKPCGLSGR